MIALDVSPIIEDVGPYPENKIRCGSFCCNTLVNFLLLNAYTLTDGGNREHEDDRRES